MDPVSTAVQIFGGLALFLFGMKVMGDGLQRVAGPKMRKILSVMTGNRFAGVATGCAVTCVIQSSSATTVMLVGFVHAGLISLTQATGVIMGANIGTTFTGWLIALLGFKIKITAMALPAITLGVIPLVLGNRKLSEWGEVLLGFGILFLGLSYMKDSVGDLKHSQTVVMWLSQYSADTIPGCIGVILWGCVVTIVVQSSSATMAVTMTLAAQGMITFETACALTLGENIGTTITANLAAMGAATPAKQTARAHFLFNVIGVILVVILFQPLLYTVGLIVPGVMVEGGTTDGFKIAAGLAAFHTIFNIANTGLWISFVKQLAWLATKLTGKKKVDERAGLMFLHPGLLNSSATMGIHAARQELGHMIEEVQSMFKMVMTLISQPGKKLGPLAHEILGKEQTVDYLEKEITEYCVSIGKLEVSLRESYELAGILSAVSDVERIGDHCESLLNLLRRRYDNKLDLTEQATKELLEIGVRVGSFLTLLKTNLETPLDDILPRARQLEESVNQMRSRMRKGHIHRLRDGTIAVDPGLIFIDMLTSFEKIGDHAFNVAEMLAGEK